MGFNLVLEKLKYLRQKFFNALFNFQRNGCGKIVLKRFDLLTLT